MTLFLQASISLHAARLERTSGVRAVLHGLIPYEPHTFVAGRGVEAYSAEQVAETVVAGVPFTGLRVLRKADPAFNLTFTPQEPGASTRTVRAQFSLERPTEAAAVFHILGALARNGGQSGWCHPSEDPYRKVAESSEPSGCRWIEILGSERVAALGESYVRKTPAARVEIVEGGGAVVQAFDDPWSYASEGSRGALAGVTAWLARADESVVRSQMDEALERVTLPVTTFHADIDEVLRLGIRMQPEPERRAYVEKWNRIAPDVLAHTSSRAALPPEDVADRDAWQQRVDLLAEQLRALMDSRTSVDIVKRAFAEDEPLALRVLDEEFHLLLHRDHPREMLDRLTDAVGAFLGTVLVERAGGRWHPRADLRESAVVVGDRALLPFRRASAFVASPDDALRYSLFAAYRHASRASG
jgi:hypothetical protein